MKEEITYIAFDGKRFDDEDECFQYELIAHLREVADDICIRSSDGELLEINEDLRPENIDYIIVKSLVAMKRIDIAFENDGVMSPYCPDREGCYPIELIGAPMYYDGEDDKWCNALDAIKEAEGLKSIFGIS